MSSHGNNHRRWDYSEAPLEAFAAEHNALFHDWQKAEAEAARLAKDNDEQCDRIFALEGDLRTAATSNETLREELRETKKWNAETLEENNRLDKALEVEIDLATDLMADKLSLKAELAALRQPGVRVPVTWDLTAEEALDHWCKMPVRERGESPYQVIEWSMEHLAAHATIAVPPGVPSVEECSALAEKSLRCAQLSGLGNGEQMYVVARDIRDRVIAALAPRPLPSRDEVAWALRGAYWESIGLEAPNDKDVAKEYFDEADAVLALFAGCQPAPRRCECDDALDQYCPKCHPLGDGENGYYPNDHNWDGPCTCSHCSPRPWTDDQIEALARALHDSMGEGFGETQGAHLRRLARTAVAFIRAEPPAASVDPDAWKTPLNVYQHGKLYRLELWSEHVFENPMAWVAITQNGNRNSIAMPPDDAARLAIWAASFANAHGCPVDVRGNLQLIGVDSAKPGSEGTVTPPAYASPTLLLSSITAAGMEMTVGECIKLLESTEADLQRAIRALVRAGFQDLGGEEWKPPLGQQPHFAWNGPTRAEAEAKLIELTDRTNTGDWQDFCDFRDWLLPQLPESRTPVDGLPKPSPLQDGIAVETHTPIAAPETLEALAEIGCEAAARLARKGPVLDSKEYNLAFVAAILRAAQAYYSPRGNDLDMLCKTYGHDSQRFRDHINSRIRYRVSVPPVGWELNVTADEMRDEDMRWLKSGNGGPVMVVDQMNNLLSFCRSRIRPVFECKECARSKKRIHDLETAVDCAHEFLSSTMPACAALEGE